jgi:lipopolysaccharide transport system ATP-binding protein
VGLTMTAITLSHVSFDFPIYNADARSLKSSLVNVATGGQLRAGNKRGVTVRALDDINLSIAAGERIGFVGHNGSGKSTLLRLLNSVYQPSSGTISIDGQIGSLIDVNVGVNPEATGLENIVMCGALLGIPRETLDANLDAIVEFSELGNYIAMPVRTYSTGMQMRLMFAIATTITPEILLMDEWLSVGDEKFTVKAEERLARIVTDSDILVFASHSRRMIQNTCERVIWLEHGRIKADGDVSEVCNAYFGLENPA